MKIEELRIGNLHIDCLGVTKKISSIELMENGSYQINGCHLRCINPIPLTVDLLIKLGFTTEGIEEVGTRDAETNEVTHQTIYGYQIANNFSLYTVDDFSDYWIAYQWRDDFPRQLFWSHPKYVHELQNLVYFLSGEEITL